MNININFLADLKKCLSSELVSAGYQVDTSWDVQLITYKYFNALRREVSVNKRQVYEASGFHCPSEWQSNYGALKAKIQSGENINPHLSKSLLRSDYEDNLLNDWGIYHFHLGSKIEQSGFVNRTGPLLFSFVTESNFYCINIYNHGAWAEKELIIALHKNWPDLISRFLIKGVTGMALSVSSEMVADFRKQRINSIIEVEPGFVYAPMGGGYTLDGSSLVVRIEADRYIDFICELEKWVKENPQSFVQEIQKSGREVVDPLEFTLQVDDVGFYAYEVNSKIRFLVGSK